MIQRIEREAGTPLLAALAERVPLTDLQSLLLEVYRSRAAGIAASSLLERYSKNRFVAPSGLDPLSMLEFDRLVFKLLPVGFEALELSPVCPLGTVAAIANLDQNSVVTTIRNTEVVADATNVLALECARQRRRLLRADPRSRERVRLAASHRVIRAQRFHGRAQRQHFRLLGLCTAGRDEGSFRFETESLVEQTAFYLRLLTEASQLGYAVDGLRVAFTDLEQGRRAVLEGEVLARLADRFPGASFCFDPDRVTGRDYYTGVCFNVYGTDQTGTDLQLVDGGFATWTQQLLGSAKERLMISGLGTERFCEWFRRSRPAADQTSRSWSTAVDQLNQ